MEHLEKSCSYAHRNRRRAKNAEKSGIDIRIRTGWVNIANCRNHFEREDGARSLHFVNVLLQDAVHLFSTI